MAFKGTEVLIPGTATQLSTLLGLSAAGDSPYMVRQLTLRINGTATGPAYLGASNAVTTAAARAAVLINTDVRPLQIGGEDNILIDLRNVWVVGTASATDIIFVTYLQ